MFGWNGVKEAFSVLLLVLLIIYFIYCIGEVVYRMETNYEAKKNKDNDQMDTER